MESWKSEEEEDNQRRHSHFRKSLFFSRNGQRERQNSSAKKGFFGVNKGLIVQSILLIAGEDLSASFI